MMIDTPENIPCTPEADIDWDNRRLCSDDSCIGIIGPDGRCRICGLPDSKATEDSYQSICVSTVQIESEPPVEDHEPESEDSTWEDRKLCSDDSCIGTIGTDGRCNVCGLTG
jgi:hypothetical protein